MNSGPERHGRFLAQSATEYTSQPHTPEITLHLWQALWIEWGAPLGLTIHVEPLTESQGKLQEREHAGDMPIYVPQVLDEQKTRNLIWRIWPEMKFSGFIERDTFVDLYRHRGWRYVERNLDAPHRDTSEDALRKILTQLRRAGLTLTEYVIASQVSKLLTGRYLDEDTNARVLGSLYQGQSAYVGFGSDGYLFLDHRIRPEFQHPETGGRSSIGIETRK